MPDLRALLGAAAVVIGGTLAGFVGYRAWQAHRPPATQLVPDAPQGDASSFADPADAGATQEAPARTPVPEQVPAITLPDLAGHPRALRDFLGSPLIINFWATWCAPCRREIPLLQQLRRTHQAERLQVIGVAVDFQAAVKQYVSRTPLGYPLLIGEDQGMIAAEKFGMEPVLPFSVFCDAQGRIVAIKIGELHPDEAQFILEAMHAVADARETLPQARALIAERLHTLAVNRAREAVTEPPPP